MSDANLATHEHRLPRWTSHTGLRLRTDVLYSISLWLLWLGLPAVALLPALAQQPTGRIHVSFT